MPRANAGTKTIALSAVVFAPSRATARATTRSPGLIGAPAPATAIIAATAPAPAPTTNSNKNMESAAPPAPIPAIAIAAATAPAPAPAAIGTATATPITVTLAAVAALTPAATPTPTPTTVAAAAIAPLSAPIAAPRQTVGQSSMSTRSEVERRAAIIAPRTTPIRPTASGVQCPLITRLVSASSSHVQPRNPFSNHSTPSFTDASERSSRRGATNRLVQKIVQVSTVSVTHQKATMATPVSTIAHRFGCPRATLSSVVTKLRNPTLRAGGGGRETLSVIGHSCRIVRSLPGGRASSQVRVAACRRSPPSALRAGRLRVDRPASLVETVTHPR